MARRSTDAHGFPEPPRSLEDVVVFAPVGGNSGLLTTFAWALLHRRGMRVVEAHLVLNQHGKVYLHEELLDPGRGLDLLHDAVGGDVVPRAGIHTTFMDDVPEGSDVAAIERAYADAAVRAAVDAVASAGTRRLVFGLLGGRNRSMTVMATVLPQALARPNDVVFDLRVVPQEAQVPGKFYFPGQPPVTLPGRRNTTVSSDEVRVDVVDVLLPRLRGLRAGPLPATYADLLDEGQQNIDAVTPPSLAVDLRTRDGQVRIDGEVVDMPPAQRIVLASLMEARRCEIDWLPPPADENDLQHPLVAVARRTPWICDANQRSKALKVLAGDPYSSSSMDSLEMLEALTYLRSKLAIRLRKFAGSEPRLQCVVPVRRRMEQHDVQWGWRLPATNVELIEDGVGSTASEKA